MRGRLLWYETKRQNSKERDREQMQMKAHVADICLPLVVWSCVHGGPSKTQQTQTNNCHMTHQTHQAPERETHTTVNTPLIELNFTLMIDPVNPFQQKIEDYLKDFYCRMCLRVQTSSKHDKKSFKKLLDPDGNLVHCQTLIIFFLYHIDISCKFH